MSLDPFTPWQEEPAALRARTVGRSDALEWLVGACEAYLEGREPPWCLVVGPRGAGKSHLLHLARSALSQPEKTLWLGEEAASMGDADRLWARLSAQPSAWDWDAAAVPITAPVILFVEGLHRQLSAMKEAGRWRLRHLLQESGAFLVGTALSAELVADPKDAFFGQLDTWTLEPISLEEARELYGIISNERELAPTAHTLSRRESLIRLAGGSPRAVVTLADAVRGDQRNPIEVSKGLLLAIQRLVPHYQQRFQDISPLGQQMMERLAWAPREVVAGELAEGLGRSSAAISKTAQQLEAAGVLTRRTDEEDRRITRYTLSEPLFRYWLEYRTRSWEHTRVAWLGRLMGAVLTRKELENVWWGEPGSEFGRAVVEEVGEKSLVKVAMRALLHFETLSEADTAVSRLTELGVEEWDAQLSFFFLFRAFREALSSIHVWRDRFRTVDVLLALIDDLEREPGRRKEHFIASLRALQSLSNGEADACELLSENMRLILNSTEPRGRSWRLNQREIGYLINIPYVRIRFAAEGRLVGHRPLIPWSHLREIDVTPDTVDIGSLMALSHLREDRQLLLKTMMMMESVSHKLSLCLRPERPVHDRGVLARILTAGRNAPFASLSWAASFAGMHQDEFDILLSKLDGYRSFDTSSPVEVTALLALWVRDAERFEALGGQLPEHPSVAEASRLRRQLQERERGHLQPELELVFRAVAPG